VTVTVVPRWYDDTAMLRDRVAVSYEDGRDTGFLPLEEWSDVLDALRRRLAVSFDSLCFQAYQDGQATVHWHSDNYDHQAILSLGATRTLKVDEYEMSVADGDLMYLTGREWHAVLADPDQRDERVALVFRKEN
jgi:hypothetical protein